MTEAKNPLLSEYVKLLGLSSLLLMIFTVFEGVAASIWYGLFAQSVEGISHRNLNQGWTIALLWIPLVLQLVVLVLLTRRVWWHKSDQTIRHYFKFYFIRTFISSFAYVTLWLFYALSIGHETSSNVISALAIVSLLLILLLMYFVVQATYLITRSSFRSTKRLLTVEDVSSTYDCICKALRAVSPATTNDNDDPAELPQLDRSEVRKIHLWLLKDRDYKIHRVAYKGTISDLDVSHLVEALNRLITNRQFYRYRHNNTTNVDDLSPSEFEANNRKFIEDNLIHPCSPQSKNKDLGNSKNGLWKTIGSILGGEKRSDRQMGQRDGIVLFPFYTMVFFFTLFLCVAYLFGFAFAFEDKRAQANKPQPSLGLFLNDDLSEDVKTFQPMPSPSPITYRLNDRQKFFYFKPGAAGITTDGDTDNDQLQRISRINDSSLSSLVDLITKALPNGPLRVLLIGRADDKSVSKITYASNYEMADARINNVRYLLQEKLIEQNVSPKQLGSIEWVESPFSNDDSLRPKEKEGKELSKIAQVLDNGDLSSQTPESLVPKELVRRLDEDLNFKHGDKPWCNEFRSLLERLKNEVLKNKVSLQMMRDIHDDISRWAAFKDAADVPNAERLADDIDAALYQIEDPAGRQRVVEVSVYDLQPDQTVTPEGRPNAKRMILMDYLYFAITRSSNDIKPISQYAKFLSTISSLTEFFFIVVFFNTLLSLERKRTQIA